MLQQSQKRILTVAALCLALSGATAHALERITLKTGFSYDCSRHEPLENGRVRLYLNETSYVDMSADQIVSVDPLPDPPVVAKVQPAPAASTDVHELLARAGAQHNIDVELLASLVKAESGGQSHAVSRTGAQGLMQLMPGTARTLGVKDSFAPDQNINGGTAYLDMLLTRYRNDLALALAAYNAGPGAVDKYHGIPPFRETRLYVVRVMKEFARRKLAAASTATATVVAH